MSSLGLPFDSSNRVPSQPKVNLKTNLIGTGDEILAEVLQDPRDIGQIAVCIADSTGGELLAHHIYEWQGTTTGWVIKSISPHDHSDSASGGKMQDVAIAAANNLYWARFVAPTHNQFHKSTSGGTYADIISGSNTYVEIDTGGSSNQYGNLIVGGKIYTFDQILKAHARLVLSSVTSSYTARFGFNMEYAQSTTNNNIKAGFEACSTCNGVNNRIVSSDGTRTVLNTSDDASVLSNYAIELEVGANVHYYKDAATVVSKNTNPPSTGLPARSNAFVVGVETSNGTAKKLQLYYLEAIGTLGETDLP